MSRSELWEEGEANESHGAGGDTTAGHIKFADFGESTTDVSALEKCTDDTDGSYELSVLCVVPVEYYTNGDK